MGSEITIITPKSIEEAERLSKTLSTSQLLPEGLRGKPGDVLATVLAGAELGLAPMQSIRGIQIIKGKPTLAADTMGALVKRRRDVCEFLVLVESTATKATYSAKRVGDPKETVLSFTIEDAKMAGLVSQGGMYTKYPAQMLRARCLSGICRAVFPDLVLGLYDPEELQSEPEPKAAPKLHVAPPPPTEKVIEDARKAAGAITTGDMKKVPPAPVEPEDAEFTEIKPTPTGEPSEQERLIIAINEAQTTKDLMALTKRIAASKDAGAREAYNKRQSELRAAHAS